MKHCKKRLITVLTTVSCMVLGGCFSQSVSTGTTVAALLADPSHQGLVIQQIEKGEKSFLFAMEDGSLYPVRVKKAEFIETMPLKIKVDFLHRHKMIAVPVQRLISPMDLSPGCTVEQQHEGDWLPVAGAAWSEEKQLWQAGETTLPEAEFRVICKNDDKEAQ